MMQPKRSARVLIGISWLGTSSLVQSALRVGLMIVLARLLTPEAYGLVALATAVVTLVEIITRLGIEPALIQRSSLSDEILAAASTYALLAALVGMALLMVLAGPLAVLLGSGPELTDIIRLIAFILPIGALTAVPRALLSRRSQFRYLAMTELLAYALTSSAVAIPLAIMGAGAWALAWSALAQPLVTLLLLGREESPFRGLRFDFAHIRDLLAFGIPLTGAKIANFVSLQADNVIVGKFLGVAELGAYSRAYALNTLPASLLAQSVDRSLFPVMSAAQADQGAIQRAIMRGLVALLAIFPPLSAYCFVYAEDIIILLLGKQWGQAVVPFQILSLAMYFRVAYKLPDIALRSVGCTGLLMRLQVVYALLVIIAALIGVRYGLVGVAIGVGIAILLCYLQFIIQGVRTLGIMVSGLLRYHLVAFIYGSLSYGLLCWFYNSMAQVTVLLPSYIGLMMGVMLLSLLYGLSLLLLPIFYGKHGLWWQSQIRMALRMVF